MPGESLLLAARSLRQAYEDVDWAATTLGPVATWSPALRNALDVALHTRFPVTLFWGPEFVLVYNEAYVPLISDKHPAALGAPAHEVFPEAWDTIGPLMQGVLAGGDATWVEDARVPLLRHGFLEESYFTFSYSPVRGRDGVVEGVLDIATETTREVLDRRRLALLSRLATVLDDLDRAEDLPRRALPILLEDAADLPAVDIHLPGQAARDPRLPVAPSSPLREGELVLETTPAGRVAWLALGPAHGGAEQGALVVLLSPMLPPDEAYLDYLRLVASSLARALDRVGAREAERGLSEALQRSLLTQPPVSDDLEVAVRYQPAAEQAQIGGDWYDAFVLPDGTLTVAIGDVAGHDQRSAAAMAQVRNLLRGVSYTLQKPPALVLSGLEAAMQGLRVDAVATAVLAQVERDPDSGRLLRFCNAGHPPPVLLGPDGRARLLETTPDMLLGLRASERTDHVLALEPGASLVLYTDGLVERRGVPLDDSLRWLTGVLEGCQALAPEALCDHLIGQLANRVEDDVALLVLRGRD